LAIIVATQRGHWGLECLYSQRFLGRNLKIWYFELGCLDVLAGQWASGVVFFVSFERSYGVFVGFKLLQAMGVECLQYFFCVNFHGIQSRHWGLTNNSQELGS
jgi:hypothetical protein